VVQGNRIGTDASGAQPLGNGAGVAIVKANNNTVGGRTPRPPTSSPSTAATRCAWTPAPATSSASTPSTITILDDPALTRAGRTLTARGTPANDAFAFAAYLYGSADNDVFVATASYAYLRGGSTFTQVSGFHPVYAYGQGGGDQAYLYGTGSSVDSFGQGGAWAYLYGNAFLDMVNAFAYVYSNPNARR
jgi:hypothetical protein